MNNARLRPPGLFVTGTDTGVGKTYVATMILREMRAAGFHVGAYKPVCSGAEEQADGTLFWQDIEELGRAIGSDESEAISPQTFRAPLAPPVAARQEGRQVDSRLLRTGLEKWFGRVDFLVVEGVGGLLSPVTEQETVADLAGDLGYRLLIVARLGLGTINHTLLTVEAARQRGLPMAGIVLNGCDCEESGLAEQTNPAEIARRCGVPVLGVVASKGGLLRDNRPITIDWLQRAHED